MMNRVTVAVLFRALPGGAKTALGEVYAIWHIFRKGQELAKA